MRRQRAGRTVLVSVARGWLAGGRRRAAASVAAAAAPPPAPRAALHSVRAPAAGRRRESRRRDPLPLTSTASRLVPPHISHARHFACHLYVTLEYRPPPSAIALNSDLSPWLLSHTMSLPECNTMLKKKIPTFIHSALFLAPIMYAICPYLGGE